MLLICSSVLLSTVLSFLNVHLDIIYCEIFFSLHWGQTDKKILLSIFILLNKNTKTFSDLKES